LRLRKEPFRQTMHLILSLLFLLQFQPALPGYRFVFPHDHGSHPEYKLEWWYYTGQLRAADGRTFGYELTFFRTGVDQAYERASAWNVRELYMAHFAVTDIDSRRFYSFEKLNRPGPGIAGAAIDKLNVWNENWSARDDDSAGGRGMLLRASTPEAALDLSLASSKPAVIHGNDGVSQKSAGAGHASHYYSMTRLETKGSLQVGDRTFEVSGESWMDHEFGTNQLAEMQVGWDWFGLQLDNGVDLMLYRMRNRDGSLDPYSSGTIGDGKAVHLTASEFSATPQRKWKSMKTGTEYPVEWTISIPSQDCQLHITPLLDAQELVTLRSTGIAYWEGAVTISGTWKGKPVQGRGYVELTGYAEKYRPRV